MEGFAPLLDRFCGQSPTRYRHRGDKRARPGCLRGQTSPNKTHQNVIPVTKGNSAQALAPKKPGDYEIRYRLGQSRRILAQRPLKVTGP